MKRCRLIPIRRMTALCLLLTLLAAAGCAQTEYTEGAYTYVLAQGYAAIVRYQGDAVDLTVPDMLGGYPVNRICESAFRDNDSLVTVRIPEGVVSLGEGMPDENGVPAPFEPYDARPIAGFACGTGAIRQMRERNVFYSCRALKKIYLPESLEVVDKCAFKDVRYELYVGDPRGNAARALTKAGYEFAIAGHPKMWFRACELDGRTVLELKEYTGEDTKIHVPEGVEKIDWAFIYNADVTAVVVPEGVVSIGGHAFYQCFALTDVTLPESLRRIESGTFAECTSLTRLRIPQGVEFIEPDAFDDCSEALVLCGAEDSYAQAWADAYGFRFEAEDGAPETK